MKYYHVFLVSMLVAAITLPALKAESSPQSLRATLASVSALELPREVARLIENSKGEDREIRSLEIVRTAVELNKSSAPLIVGAASRVAPELAAKFGPAATEVVPAMAAGIARAAAASAPAYAADIAAAIAKVRPAQYIQVAHEVGYAVPGKDTEIVNAVIVGLPNLKPFNPGGTSRATLTDLVIAAPQVDQAARRLGMQTEEFLGAQLTPTQLEKVTADAASASNSEHVAKSSNRGARGVPFVPGAGTPGEANRAQTVVVTPGQGRSYYRPKPRPGY